MIIATLNHNLPDLTDSLVNQLKRDPVFNKCELMVIDNGSTESLAKNTTHRLEENIFFGGGINAAIDYFLSTDHYYLFLIRFLLPILLSSCLELLPAVQELVYPYQQHLGSLIDLDYYH